MSKFYKEKNTIPTKSNQKTETSSASLKIGSKQLNAAIQKLRKKRNELMKDNPQSDQETKENSQAVRYKFTRI